MFLFSDPVEYWRHIKEVGLIDDVFKDILTRIMQLKMSLFNPEIEADPYKSLEGMYTGCL